jgi:hypothetical protein
MKIVEIGDCSMVIMKDSSDSMWFSVGNIYRKVQSLQRRNIRVRSINNGENALATSKWFPASESIYTAGRLILFFQDFNVPDVFSVGDSVELEIYAL